MLNKSLIVLLLTLPLTAAEPDWLASFTVPGEPGSLANFQFDKTSVRITAKLNPFSVIPALRGGTMHSVNSTLAPVGDFEWLADYTVHQFGTGGQPPQQEASASFTLVFPGYHGHFGFNVGHRTDRGPCFNGYHGLSTANGYHFNMMSFKRIADTGKLCLRRQGGELVFLAADGPDAALQELVRIPIRADLAPKLNFTAWQGNGNLPPEVDVTYANMTLRADSFTPVVPQRATPLGPPKPFGVRLDYTGKPARLLGDFKVGGGHGVAFSIENDAVRIRPPVKPVHTKVDNTYWFRESRYGLEGDFEVSWRYAMAALGPISREGPGNLSISVQLRGDSPLGSYSFAVGAQPDNPRRHAVSIECPTKTGTHHNSQNFRTAATEGRMTIRRVGAELTFLLQEPLDATPRVLSHVPYTTDRVPRLRLTGYQGGNATNALDGTIREFVVKAERLVDTETGEVLGTAGPPTGPAEAATAGSTVVADPVTLDTLPQNRSNKWWYVKLAVMVLGGGLLVAGGVLLWRSRRK